jgi:hypothetical protein
MNDDLVYEPYPIQPIVHKRWHGNRVVIYKKDIDTGNLIWVETCSMWIKMEKTSNG